MVKIQGAVRLSVKARAVDDVRDFLDGYQVVHDRPVTRIVLQIGVLNDKDRAGRGRHRGLDGATFAAVLGVENYTDRTIVRETVAGSVRQGRGAGFDNWELALEPVARAVVGPVVYNDDFFADTRERHANSLENQ